jgi:hypothetical protein
MEVGTTMPTDFRTLQKYPDHPNAMAAAPNMYSRIKFHATNQATYVPKASLEYE